MMPQLEHAATNVEDKFSGSDVNRILFQGTYIRPGDLIQTCEALMAARENRDRMKEVGVIHFIAKLISAFHRGYQANQGHTGPDKTNTPLKRFDLQDLAGLATILRVSCHLPVCCHLPAASITCVLACQASYPDHYFTTQLMANHGYDVITDLNYGFESEDIDLPAILKFFQMEMENNPRIRKQITSSLQEINAKWKYGEGASPHLPDHMAVQGGECPVFLSYAWASSASYEGTANFNPDKKNYNHANPSLVKQEEWRGAKKYCVLFAEELFKKKIDCFFDTSSISGMNSAVGNTFSDKMRMAVSTCAIVVMFIDSDYVKSGNCRKELGFAK